MQESLNWRIRRVQALVELEACLTTTETWCHEEEDEDFREDERARAKSRPNLGVKLVRLVW